MMAPATNQFFYIAATPPLFVLGIEGNNTDPGARIILWPMEVTDAQSQLWRMTDDGHIISQLNGCAITWDAAQSQVVTAVVGDPNHPYQLWSVAPDGSIANQAFSGELLTLETQNNVPLITLTERYAPAFRQPQDWTLLASQSPGSTTTPTWVYFQSALQDTDHENCVFNVEGNKTTPGTEVIAWPFPQDPANSSNELWQITPDGRILSAQGNNLVLTLSDSWSEDDGGYYVTVDTQQVPLPLTQVWDLSTPNQIRSAFSGDFLCPSGGTEGPITLYDGPAIVAAPGNTQSASYTWYTVPLSPSALQTIAVQQPVPFPEFTGDEGEAYSYILSQLDIPSLRDLYYDLSADLDGCGIKISRMTVPSSIPQEAWDAVAQQLTTEILYASTTRNVFFNYAFFQNTLFGADGTALNGLISDAGITQGENEPNVGGILLAVFEGILYTALCALPGVGAAAISLGGILGNLMETGINVGLASSGSDSISPDPFQVAVSKLWDELNSNSLALLAAMETMETTILKDWGMLQSVYPLATQRDRPDSLFWDPSTTSKLISAAIPGYEISVMQMLLPAKYSIYVTDNSAPDDIPACAQWQSGGTTYWIAESVNAEMCPAEQTMQKDIWGNGVTQADFFQSAAGWGFTTINADNRLGYFTFTNLTQNVLRLTGPDEGFVGYLQNENFIGPYQSCIVELWGAYEFQVTDFNSPQGQVAQVEVAAGLGEMGVRVASTGSGYQFTAPITPVYGDGSPVNAVQIGLTQTPDTQT